MAATIAVAAKLGPLPGLCSLAKLVKPAQKFLVLSGLSDPIYATRAIQLGALGFVAKGAEPEVLAAAVLRVLES